MRQERTAILNEVKDKLGESGYLFLADYTGLPVAEITALRALLRDSDSELHVVKNTFLSLAAKELGWDDLSDLLTGPTAMVTGNGDVSEVAKALVKFVKAHERTAVKGGCLEGKVMTSADVDALAKLPAREVMLAMLVGTVAAPMTQLVGVMNQKLLSLLYALKAVEDKKRGAA